MKDFSFWKEYEGTSEGSGRSEKIWLINPYTDEIGLFKYKKDENTTDHISECLAYKLSNLIRIPCARFEIGTYNGREGSMSYSIIQNNECLVEGIDYISSIYPEYDPEKFFDNKSGDVYSLSMIEKALSKVGLFDEFLQIPIFDYLIGNTDRHQSNWAVLISDEKEKLSPLYDNSSSLCAYISDNQVMGYMGRDQLKWKSLVETKSKSLIRRTIDDCKKPTHLEMIEYLNENYYYETKDIVERIITEITDTNVSGILNEYIGNGLSNNKADLIKKFLLYKAEAMNKVYAK